MLHSRTAAWAIAVASTLAIAAARGEAAQQEQPVTCTNPASGASWQIRIDYDRGTVDANPASISATEIAWRDAKDGRNYRLNRASGALTVVVASSTGGTFQHDQCSLPR